MVRAVKYIRGMCACITIADTVVWGIDQSRDINISDAMVRVTGDG
jgi:hypothetical protein